MKYPIKKLISIFLIIIFFIQLSFISNIKKAIGAGLPVIDASNLGVNITQTTFLGELVGTSVQQDIKEWVLDGLAGMFAKQIIHQVAGSVVNWINSGFQGSPAFIQNPGAFFLDVADQITGDFLAKTGGPLTNLCSPFSIDIRLALAFKYHPSIQKRYSCTLSTIIKNTTNAVENASINGFTAGDFRQGGWPSFVSLTTEPQNNLYGAYLTAESELSWRVAQAQNRQKDEINAGKGFLSWKKCKEVPLNPEALASEDPNDPRLANYYENGVRTSKSCTVETPGSVISNALENNLGSGLRQLELADEINEIVSALFAQLITQVLQGGLGSVSGSGPGDSTSYISSIQTEARLENSEELRNMREKLLASIEGPIKSTEQYIGNKVGAYQIFANIKKTYEDAITCYDEKIKRIESNQYMSNNIDTYKMKISEIDNIIKSYIIPKVQQYYSGAQDAEYRMKTLQDIKNKANSAKTINDLNIPSQQFSTLVQNKGLTNANDIQNSIQSYENATIESETWKEDSENKLRECKVLN